MWLAPGRANLMGEHTDYNDGVRVPVRAPPGGDGRGGGRLRAFGIPAAHAVLAAGAGDGGFGVDLDGLAPGPGDRWAAYPAGVAWALEAAGYRLPGACVAIDSDVPVGAGLSSSAALECATALALTALASVDVPRADLVTIARRAENEFVGVPTGVMDQSASLRCQAGHALLLDCRSLEVTQVPFDPATAGASLLLVNTWARPRPGRRGVRAAAGRVRGGRPPAGPPVAALRHRPS